MHVDKIKAEMIRQLKLLAVPPDFDQLCQDGVLERIGKSKKRFKVVDWKRLPEYLILRMQRIQAQVGSPEIIVEFANTIERAKELLRKLKP